MLDVSIVWVRAPHWAVAIPVKEGNMTLVFATPYALESNASTRTLCFRCARAMPEERVGWDANESPDPGDRCVACGRDAHRSYHAHRAARLRKFA